MSIGKNSIARAAQSAAPSKKTEAFSPKAAPVSFTMAVKNIVDLAVYPAVESPPPELLRSVKARGVLVPLLLAHTPADEYYLIRGRNRLLAARELRLAEVPVCVAEVLDQKEALLLLQEVEAAVHSSPLPVHNQKFTAVATLRDDMPVYLL